MNYYEFTKDTENGYKVVNEKEFYRESIKGFDNVEYISNISQVCLKFYKDGVEIARQVMG